MEPAVFVSSFFSSFLFHFVSPTLTYLLHLQNVRSYYLCRVLLILSSSHTSSRPDRLFTVFLLFSSYSLTQKWILYTLLEQFRVLFAVAFFLTSSCREFRSIKDVFASEGVRQLVFSVCYFKQWLMASHVLTKDLCWLKPQIEKVNLSMRPWSVKIKYHYLMTPTQL